MTRNNASNNLGTGHVAERDAGLTIDTASLVADLFEKFAAAQLDVLRARTAGDRRLADECVLRMRATGLLIACLPTVPHGKNFTLKVHVANALREEDGEEASHAWTMVERAIALDEHRHVPPLVPNG